MDGLIHYRAPRHIAGAGEGVYILPRALMNPLPRHLVRLGILFLVVRILADMATPLLPGAFRLDPTTSVQVAEAAPPTVVATVPPGPSGFPGRVGIVHMPQQRRESRPAPHAYTFRPRIVHLSESGSSPASDDD